MKTKILNLLKGNEALINAENLDVRLTLAPFINYLEETIKQSHSIKSAFLEFVLEQFNKHPELNEGATIENLFRHRELLDMIYAVVSVPVESETDVFWALGFPITPVLFYGTDAVYDLMMDKSSGEIKESVIETPLEIVQTKRPELIYNLVLEKVYGFKNSFKTTITKTLVDEKTGLLKYYTLNFDLRFLNVHPKAELPEINAARMQKILHELKPLEALQSLLPLSMFRFEGLSVLTLTDVTEQYTIEHIKSLLFHQGECETEQAYYNDIIRALKTLVQNNEVEFGLLPILKVNDKLVFHESTCLHSRLITSAHEHGIGENAYLAVAENYFKNPKLLLYKSITPEDEARQVYLRMLKKDGIVSYALIPIYYNNTLGGVLEVYSRKENVVDETVLPKLDPVIPLMAQILQASIDEFNSSLDEIVKEKFTSIQPAVQWKFNEAAWHFLKAKFLSKNPKMETIFFKDVYPLYGAIDIRNSTIERNNALRNDLKIHFDLLQKTLTAIRDITNLPIIGELVYKTKKKFGAILESDSSNEAISVHDFLQNDVDPMMAYFRKTIPATVPIIDTYYLAADQETGSAHENRRQLEHSMEMITGAINNYLELFINEQKQSYPTYFEKFRTDGIEYDMYIGQSIAPDHPFDLLYLRNLRLWQVASMAAIARITHLLKPQLPKRLETTQLIFTNSNTIDICFRNDERRFDVEGAYNIRYQIIKKRIDKVHLKGTTERLTQTGKIAIIYFNSRDADEYTKYIHYLQEQGSLLEDLEEVELEELQGVKGLKALRVGVKME